MLTSLALVPTGSDSGREQIAATLGRIPAAPVMETTRGATDVQVYRKAAPATVLVETDRGLGSGSIISNRGRC